MHRLANKIWYSKKNFLSILLLPLSLIYRVITAIRRLLYQRGIFKRYRAPVPVIIVGNITVGGTGKTPCVIALVILLKNKGYHPGVLTRGCGGKCVNWPQYVTDNSDALFVGDEAVLIAQKTSVPVIVSPDRSASAKKLVNDCQCDVIVSDDGLQHYALARDIEIALIDGTRHLGNGWCLPAGPLREPPSRLHTVDFVVVNGRSDQNDYAMQFAQDDLVNVFDASQKMTFETLKTCHQKIAAVAGIANPQRFFDALRSQGIAFEEHLFPDHHAFVKTDFKSFAECVILMTEKDAVKCRSFADERMWAVVGHAQLSELFVDAILQRLLL